MHLHAAAFSLLSVLLGDHSSHERPRNSFSFCCSCCGCFVTARARRELVECAREQLLSLCGWQCKMLNHQVWVFVNSVPLLLPV